MAKKELGDHLSDLWFEGPDIYHAVRQAALKNVPLKFNKKHILTNLKAVNEETCKLYRLYKKGKATIEKDPVKRNAVFEMN